MSNRKAEPETPEQREAAIVRRLAGEWGEMEAGPCESIDQCVDLIHESGRVLLLHIEKLIAWRHLARELSGLDAYNDERLQTAMRKALAERASIPLPPGWVEFTDVPSGHRAAKGPVGNREAFAYRSRRNISCRVLHRGTGRDDQIPVPLDIAAWLLDGTPEDRVRAQPVESTAAGSSGSGLGGVGAQPQSG